MSANTTATRAPRSAPPVTLLSAPSFFNAVNRNFFDYIERSFGEYGDLFRLDMFGKPTYFVHHPDHLHELLVTRADDFIKNRDYTDPQRGLARFFGNGLLTSNGDFWKRQRKLVAPALHTRRIAAYAGIMVDETIAMLDRWENGGRFDIAHEMTQATLQIVSKALFSLDSSDMSSDALRIGQIMGQIQEFVGSTFTLESLLPTWIPTPRRWQESVAKRDLDAIVYRIINNWRRAGEDRGDLLSMLLMARDDDDRPMTDLQARDEIVTMFLAGHETTANTLNWLWMLLAQHPEAERKLHNELDQVLGGADPKLEDLRRLPYTEQVVREAMRLFPPAFAFNREAVRDTTIGGYAIPAGADIQVIIWTTHRDARWWDDPLAFRPERFAPENESSLKKYAYLPFGGGPRVCIGNSFALMEAQIMTALIAGRFRLQLAPGQVVTPEPLLTLRPRGGLPMTVTPRVPAAQPEARVAELSAQQAN